MGIKLCNGYRVPDMLCTDKVYSDDEFVIVRDKFSMFTDFKQEKCPSFIQGVKEKFLNYLIIEVFDDKDEIK